MRNIEELKMSIVGIKKDNMSEDMTILTTLAFEIIERLDNMNVEVENLRTENRLNLESIDLKLENVTGNLLRMWERM